MNVNIEIVDSRGASRIFHCPDEAVIGKGERCDIRLDSWRVSKEHARLFVTPAGLVVEDLGTLAGVQVNGRKIDVQFGPLSVQDEVAIGPYKIRLCPPLDRQASSSPGTLQGQSTARSSASEVRKQVAEAALRDSLEAARLAQAQAIQARAPSPQGTPSDFPLMVTEAPEIKALEFEWRRRLHGMLIESMDLRRQDVSRMSDEQLRREAEQLIRDLLKANAQDLPKSLNIDSLCRQVLNEAVGLGPLEELLVDDSVSEIMVNRFDQIYVERSGRLQKHPMTFTGDAAVLAVIERIVSPLGRRIDESSPMVDARLKDGSRVNAIIPPLSLKGPVLTIRKFSKRKLTAQDLVTFGSISEPMAQFLDVCVEARKNIIVSGGTGSGKTTLLNILSNFIPMTERVITVEDAAELQLSHEHLVTLEARPVNVEGKGAISIRDLVRNTLRMRPDRIVVGECRGAEALDMLQAMNTGHEGSLTTLHANTPRDALARLETMVLMAGMDLPLLAIREQIASAVDIIVQQTRFACGSRLVTHVVEVTGIESGTIQLQEIFKFVQRGYDQETHMVRGHFTGCDMVPAFYEELQASGRSLDIGIFKPAMPVLSRSVAESSMDEDTDFGEALA